MKAVILAGGLGTRLKPFTEVIPKPLLPIGEKAVLEIQIERFHRFGVDEIYLATSYKSDYIEKFFGDGSRYGVKLSISREEIPLGTAGPLTLLRNQLTEPFIVMNGDILTKLNFLKMRRFHKAQKASMTIGTKKHETQLPFGTLEIKNHALLAIKEKPKFSYDISNGIYIVSREALPLVPKNRRFTMPDLATLLVQKKLKVACYPVKEYWIAVEQLDQFTEALTMKKKWM